MDSVTGNQEDLLKLAELHPELAAYLQAHPLPAPPSDLVGLRAVYEKINQRAVSVLTADFKLDADAVTIKNQTVTARDGYEIPIRIYHPSSSINPGPLIVNIHGGAKIMGTLTDEDAHCRIFAEKFNATCINIEYRLAPEHKTPVMVYDCWDVVSWAAENAGELGADPKKGFYRARFVSRSSDGGHHGPLLEGREA
jgi:acetyl esterase/lipase